MTLSIGRNIKKKNLKVQLSSTHLSIRINESPFLHKVWKEPINLIDSFWVI